MDRKWSTRAGAPGMRTLLGILALGLSGCSCDEDRPYTPFQVASALPPVDADAPTVASATVPTGVELAARVTPLRASGLPETWEAFGRTLHAPSRTGFAGGVELPADGGAPARVLAWVFPKSGGRPADGGLFVFDDAGRTGALLTKLPDFLPTGPDCEIELGPLGGSEAGVFSLIHVACKGRLLPGTATGAFVLVTPDAARAPFVLRLAESASAEKLVFEPSGSAPDAGGTVRELTVHIDLLAPNGAHARLPLRFVGKAGGLSRIADAPSSDLEALSSELGQLVPKKKEREAALARIDATRRWVHAVCEEAGTARVSDAQGRALSCGAIKPSLDRLTEAAIEAYLFRDEPWKAIGEYERADFHLGAPPAATKARWAARIRSKTTTVAAEVSAEYPLRLGLEVPYPFAAPLGYDERGKLYGLTAAGEVQALGEPEPAAPLDAAEPDTRPNAWPLRPKSSDDRLLAALVPSCDRSEVQLSFVADGGAAADNQVLPLLAPRPCRGLGGRPLSAVPLGWQGTSLLVIAAGEPVLSAGALRAPERPIAWGTSLGVEVWSSRGHVSFRGPTIHDLHHCVTFSASATSSVERVACIRGRKAVELRPSTDASGAAQ
jgi:hypothetical protein